MESWRGEYNPQVEGSVTSSGLPLLALSIREPWVYAILSLGKRIENRSWTTWYRGPVMLHASSAPVASWDLEGFLDVCAEVGSDVHAAALVAIGRAGWRDSPYRAPKFESGIRGVAVIEDVLPKGKAISPWHVPGQYGIVLGAVREILTVPCKGLLGFFRPDRAVVEAVHAELASVGA